MSRASISFERQPVAPNESIWVHSPAVGRFARKTILLDGKRRWTASTSAGPPSAPKLGRLGGGELRDLALHVIGGDNVLAHPELLGLEPERQADHLRQVED